VSAVEASGIDSVLIALDGEGGRLLLPKLAVPEVLGLEALSFQANGPVWLLGMAQWREREIPAISFEAMCGQAMPVRSRRSRLVVINSLGVHLETGWFALLSQGHPHLATLSEHALQPEVGDHAPVELCRLRLGNTRAVIPDLETIELQLSDALQATAAS